MFACPKASFFVVRRDIQFPVEPKVLPLARSLSLALPQTARLYRLLPIYGSNAYTRTHTRRSVVCVPCGSCTTCHLRKPLGLLPSRIRLARFLSPTLFHPARTVVVSTRVGGTPTLELAHDVPSCGGLAATHPTVARKRTSTTELYVVLARDGSSLTTQLVLSRD